MAIQNPDDCLSDLYKRYHQSVVSYLVRFGFPREYARDLAQDVFVRVCKGWNEFRREAEWAYLKTIALRTALNEIRRRKAAIRNGREVSLEELPYIPESTAKNPWTGATPPSPEDDVSAKQELARRSLRLREAISTLPAGVRVCLSYWLAGYKYHEIVRIMGITLDAVKSRLHEARNQLRALLNEELESIDGPDKGGEDDHD